TLVGGCKQSADNAPPPRAEAAAGSQQAAAPVAAPNTTPLAATSPAAPAANIDAAPPGQTTSGLTPEQTLAAAPTAAGTPAVAPSVSGGPVAGSDRAFVSDAVSGGMAEVEAGRLVAAKSTDADLKAFAMRMAQDHTKANDELLRIASTKGISVPTAVGAADRARLDRLNSLSGARLRQIYLAQFGTAAHQKTIQLFERQSREGQDADLKAYADRTLPTLQEHLRMVQQLRQGRMSGQANSGSFD
ncbi:MAG: DUF4142 domain-containing protein, partial [Zoogloea sp.]|nr:DUF4142 domain-containing protein [Zoogloea sp.]